MEQYTKTVNYITPTSLSVGEVFEPEKYSRIQIDPNHPSYYQKDVKFSLEGFKYPYLPLFLGKYHINTDEININVLRLAISTNDYKIHLPHELMALKDFIADQCNYHRQYYGCANNPFIYITVRTTDGDEECYYKTAQDWHVDGFQGSRTDTHIPEQDIVWSNVNPTEFTLQPVFCEGLNTSKHNVMNFFKNSITDNNVYSGVENGVYLLTPYNVHRVSNNKFVGKRVFIRLTFSPVPIIDKTNTTNPMLNMPTETRKDVRDFLWDYECDEFKQSGFKKL